MEELIAAGNAALSAEHLYRQATMAEANMVLGIIDFLDQLDQHEPNGTFAARFARLESCLNQLAPTPDRRVLD